MELAGCWGVGGGQKQQEYNLKKKINEPPLPKSQEDDLKGIGFKGNRTGLAFLQVPVTSALGSTWGKPWTRENVFISSVD